jgi:uncharacterized repeat protein (TIGR01451 family)
VAGIIIPSSLRRLTRRFSVKRLVCYVTLSTIVGSALIAASVALLLTATAGRMPAVSAATGCALSVEKSADTLHAGPGDTIVWAVTVTNTGTADCAGVQATDLIDDLSTAYVSASGSVGTTDYTEGPPPEVTWDVGTLAAGQTATLTIRVTVNDPVKHEFASNEATVEAEEGGITVPSNEVSVLLYPLCDLRVRKEAEEDMVAPRGRVTFDITVTNLGPEDCPEVFGLDELPPELVCESASFVDAEDAIDKSAACQGDSSASWSYDGLLGAGERLELTLVAQAGAEEENDVENRACALGLILPLRIVGGPAGATVEQENPFEDLFTCGTATIDIGHPNFRRATATPTATQTAVPPSSPTPKPPPPTARPQATIAPPATGNGTGGGLPWLPIGLALSGVLMLAVSGGVLAKKRIQALTSE